MSRPRSARLVPVLGATSGILAVAAMLAGLEAAPAASPGESGLAIVDSGAPTSEAESLLAGPLGLPSIGVVAPGFDDEYDGLPDKKYRTASATSAAPLIAAVSPGPTAPQTTTPLPPSSFDPLRPQPEPEAAVNLEPTEPQPSEPDPTTPTTPSGPTAGSASEPTTGPTTPPTTAPTTPPTTEPTTPTTTEPTTPTTTEPTSALTTEPTTAPTTAPTPTDTALAPGEQSAVTDAAGAVVLRLTVEAITPDVACTSPDAGAAGNQHLIALVVRVIPVMPQALDVAGFGLLNPDGSLGAVDTVPATSCLPVAEAIPAGLLSTGQPYVGTVILDAPATAGTIV